MLQGFFDHQLLDLGQKGIAVIQLKNTKFPYSSDYFASHKLPLQPNTILYNTHRLARRNYAAGHQKLLSLAGGSAVDVLLILQWKSACERQFQSDLGFKVLLLFRRELSLSKKQSEYSWNVSSSSENKSQKPKTAQKTSFTIGHGVFHSICMRCYWCQATVSNPGYVVL